MSEEVQSPRAEATGEARIRRQALTSGPQLPSTTPTIYSNPIGPHYFISNIKVLSGSAFYDSESWRRNREINLPE